jgi:uncharacterized membrane protein YeaQ/YmgE (transglycosylase-associated protein family)
MDILAWIVVGLVAGLIARALMPGNQNEPSGWLGTIGLGILGAIVGGFLSRFFFVGGGATGINIGSIVTAVVGACVLLFVLRLLKK